MEYFLPGVAPTHRRVELALVVIAHFEGDLLAHEHIYWDHASVLVQVGLLERGKLPITGVAGQAGSDAFFQKPVDFQQVAVGLRRIMARDV